MHPTQLQTLFPEPKTLDQARRQANIAERARNLFTTGGYSWYLANRDPLLFGVCGPDGQHYGVSMRDNSCTCPGFNGEDKDCKHRIAVANSAECREVSLIRQLEAACESADDLCTCDRAERLVRESGYCPF